MSQIQDLIEHYCPDGVEYRPLKDVVTRHSGTPITAEKMKTLHKPGSPIRVFAGGSTFADVDATDISTKNVIHVPGIIVKSRGNIAFQYYDKPFTHKSEFWSYTSSDNSIDLRFIYFFLQGKQNDMMEVAKSKSTKMPQIACADTDNLDIPVPPIEMQRAIVEALDSFVGLERELRAELDVRTKQRDDYSESLLDPSSWNNHTDSSIGNLMTVIRGASPRPIQKYVTDDPAAIPWIKIGDIEPEGKYITKTSERVTADGAAKSRYLHPGSFVLSNSMSFGRPYILKIAGCIHDGWLALSEYEDSFDKDFLYWMLRSNPIQNYWQMHSSSGTVSNLNAEIVRGTPISFPSLDEQKSIASTLESFRDMDDALRSELDIRHAQYEHYRDALLNLPKKVV